jgi:O-antigen/teichoic acid export membrane protein
MPNIEPPDDAAQRGRQRVRRTVMTGAATLLAKGSGVSFGFLAIPLAANYLGTERFGVWLLIGNFLAWVSLADLGLGSSLTNLVATADAEDDLAKVRSTVTTSLAITAWICVVLLLLGAGGYPLIDWRRLFNLQDGSIATEAAWAALVAAGIFGCRLLLSIPIRLYSAYQEGYIYQFWAGLGSMLGFLGLLFGTWSQSSFALLIGLFFGGMTLADLLAAYYLFDRLRPQIRPRWADLDRSLVKTLLGQGGQFWILQVASIVYLQTDLIIVAQLFGAKAVASYGVVFKLFSIVDFVQTSFVAPLWSAYSEAWARKDWAWILTIFRRSLYWSLLWSVGSGLLLCWLTPLLVNRWLGTTPPIELMVAMFCLSVATAISKCLAYLLNGLGQLASQARYGVMAAILNPLLSIILGQMLGLSGVTWSTVICIGIFSLGLVGSDVRRIVRNFPKNEISS